MTKFDPSQRRTTVENEESDDKSEEGESNDLRLSENISSKKSKKGLQGNLHISEDDSSEESEEEEADGAEVVKIKNIKKPYSQVKKDLKNLDKCDKEQNPLSKDSTAKESLVKDDTSSLLKIIGIGILMIILLSITALIIFSRSSHNFRNVKDFLSKFSEMEKQFPNQYKLYWRMMKNGGKRHLEKVYDVSEEKLTPQSYMIAGYEGSRETVDCYIEKLVLAFTTEQLDEKQIIDSDEFKDEDNPVILAKKLHSFLNGTKKLVVLKDLDKLQYNVANLLMSYADEHNEVATYPQSLLFLTVQLPFSFDPSRTRKDDERLVNEYFMNEVWGSTDKDLKDALWSRVGDGLMLIKPEETNACTKHADKDL